MKPKRLISLLVAVCMMITMLPLSAVTAFAADTASSPDPEEIVGDYKYAYTVNGGNATITKFLGPVNPANTGPYDIEIPTELDGHTVTAIGSAAFQGYSALRKVTIPDSVTSIGTLAFSNLSNLTTLSLGKGIKTIGQYAFFTCNHLPSVTIPQSVTSIGTLAFACCGMHTLTIKGPIESMGSNVFAYCAYLESVTLPAGFTSFGDSLEECPAGCVFYYNDDVDAAKALLENPDNAVLEGHKLLYLCNVTFDANGGKLNDSAEVPVYKTEKITDTKANELTAINAPTRAGYNFTGWYTADGKPFDVNETAITEDITLHAGWEFDPNAPGYRPLTVTGGTVTVKYDGSDVTSKLNSNTDAATGQKTYYVPDGAEVTVTLDKTAVPNGKVFDGWSTSNLSLTGQDYKATSITFTMNSDVDIAAQYRDAATDHTHDTAVCRPLTVTGGIVTVKNGDKDVTNTLTVTTDETTGKKTYSVPDGATVTVTLDKTQIPEGMVFDIWSTGKFSLPLGQDYKAESITFTMSNMSSDVDIAAQYRDATIEDDGPNVLGTAAIIGTAAVGTAVLGYQAYSLGAEFAGKLMALPYFPSNRSALAMMLWEDAGKPMPESELLYPDVGQEERDMDLQHAARWAMENDLVPDLNDEGTAPEEMKFYPDNAVSKIDVLKAWQKTQELKQNA